jgi:hypothetical protein
VAKTGGRGIRSIRDLACGIKSSLLCFAYYTEIRPNVTIVSGNLGNARVSRFGGKAPANCATICLTTRQRLRYCSSRLRVLKHRFDGSSAHSDRTPFRGRFGFLRLAFSCAADSRATCNRWNTGGACRTTVQQSFFAYFE